MENGEIAAATFHTHEHRSSGATNEGDLVAYELDRSRLLRVLSRGAVTSAMAIASAALQAWRSRCGACAGSDHIGALEITLCFATVTVCCGVEALILVARGLNGRWMQILPALKGPQPTCDGDSTAMLTLPGRPSLGRTNAEVALRQSVVRKKALVKRLWARGQRVKRGILRSQEVAQLRLALAQARSDEANAINRRRQTEELYDSLLQRHRALQDLLGRHVRQAARLRRQLLKQPSNPEEAHRSRHRPRTTCAGVSLGPAAGFAPASPSFSCKSAPALPPPPSEPFSLAKGTSGTLSSCEEPADGDKSDISLLGDEEDEDLVDDAACHGHYTVEGVSAAVGEGVAGWPATAPEAEDQSEVRFSAGVESDAGTEHACTFGAADVSAEVDIEADDECHEGGVGTTSYCSGGGAKRRRLLTL